MLAARYYDHNQRVRYTDSISPYISLAVAIVQQAADDYKRLGANTAKRLDNTMVYKSDILRFLRSGWFSVLTMWCDPIDPERAIRALERRSTSVPDT